MALQWITHQTRSVALDARHQSILITTWLGAPNAELVDHYFQASDALAAGAMASEQRLVHVVDLSHSALPDAATRKRLLEHTRVTLLDEVSLCTLVASDDPGLRSLAQAMRWRRQPVHRPGPGSPELVLVEEVGHAIELALDRLSAAHIPPPAGLSPGRYRTPLL